MIFSFLSARYFIRSFENTCLTIESTGIHLLIFKVLDTAILAKEILFCAFLIMFSFTINVFPLYLKLWGAPDKPCGEDARMLTQKLLLNDT